MYFNKDDFYNFESLEEMTESAVAGRKRGSNLHKVRSEDSANNIEKFPTKLLHRFVRPNVTLLYSFAIITKAVISCSTVLQMFWDLKPLN